MNIVITGITSLLGSNIAEYFSRRGNNVISVGRERIFSPYNKLYRFETINWQNPKEFFLKENQIDIFIHCAGLNAKECYLNPKEAFIFNSETTLKLAKLCSENNVKIFVYLSTIHVYSPNPIGIINENNIPKNDHPYAKSKYKAEEYLKNNFIDSNMQYLILRLSNIIAAPNFLETNCWGLLAQNICRQIFEKKQITLNSNPKILRDFVGINQLNKFLEYYFKNLPKMISETYNFASGETITILDLANKIKNNYEYLYKKNIRICFETSDLDKFENQSYSYSLKKIESLGYKIDKSTNDEINQLLKFCFLNYSKI